MDEKNLLKLVLFGWNINEIKRWKEWMIVSL